MGGWRRVSVAAPPSECRGMVVCAEPIDGRLFHASPVREQWQIIAGFGPMNEFEHRPVPKHALSVSRALVSRRMRGSSLPASGERGQDVVDRGVEVVDERRTHPCRDEHIHIVLRHAGHSGGVCQELLHRGAAARHLERRESWIGCRLQSGDSCDWCHVVAEQRLALGVLRVGQTFGLERRRGLCLDMKLQFGQCAIEALAHAGGRGLGELVLVRVKKDLDGVERVSLRPCLRFMSCCLPWRYEMSGVERRLFGIRRPMFGLPGKCVERALDVRRLRERLEVGRRVRSSAAIIAAPRQVFGVR